MSILFAVNQFVSSIRKFINEQQTNMNMKANIPTIIIERQIGENLQVGLGKYPTNIENKSTTQLLQYRNTYYGFEKFNKEDTKLLYHWINIAEPKEHVLLEFEKVPPASITYKLIQTKDANSNANSSANSSANFSANANGRLEKDIEKEKEKDKEKDKDKNKNVILQEGEFHYKFFKPIGMMETYYIDEIATFASSR